MKEIYFLLLSSYTKYGKSIIQQNLKISSSINPNSEPKRVRTFPAIVAASFSLSEAKNTLSPGFTFVISFMEFSLLSPRNLAIGPFAMPSLSNVIYPRPLAPNSFCACSIFLSKTAWFLCCFRSRDGSDYHTSLDIAFENIEL